MFKVLDKNLYWSMNDENHCASDDLSKYWEFFEKSKGIDEIFDKIVNHLFNTNDEVINYLFTENGTYTKDALAMSSFYDKYFNFEMSFPINNSYFMHIQEKQCKKIDARRNNIVAFITNITKNEKIEVYLSETNFNKYYFKIDKIVPVVVFNLPEYAQNRIYSLFHSAFKRLFIKNDYVNAQIYFDTRYPIIDAEKRKKIIFKKNCIKKELLKII